MSKAHILPLSSWLARHIEPSGASDGVIRWEASPLCQTPDLQDVCELARVIRISHYETQRTFSVRPLPPLPECLAPVRRNILDPQLIVQYSKVCILHFLSRGWVVDRQIVVGKMELTKDVEGRLP